MTSLLEKAISVIAPHRCLVCSKENYILCVSCAHDVFVSIESACAFCDRPTAHQAVCKTCQKQSPLTHIWVAGEYDGMIARLIQRFKFQSLRAATVPLAAGMASVLPVLEPDTIIVAVPTAPRRIRIRGYDQTALLADELAQLTGLKHRNLLQRNHNLRQLGTQRHQRQQQAKNAFTPLPSQQCADARILLVDDVITTGATINAAAKVLQKAGASEINAIVIAKQALTHPSFPRLGS